MSEDKAKESIFEKLRSHTTVKHAETPLLEKKQSFDYICWATALASVLEVYPDASWEITRFDGLPYLKTDLGYFVEVSMTINDLTRTMLHAVANGNRANKQPTVTDIFNSTQRALAKVIAVHGFGLQLWEEAEREQMRKEQAEWEKAQKTKGQTTEDKPKPELNIPAKAQKKPEPSKAEKKPKPKPKPKVVEEPKAEESNPSTWRQVKKDLTTRVRKAYIGKIDLDRVDLLAAKLFEWDDQKLDTFKSKGRFNLLSGDQLTKLAEELEKNAKELAS